jgi:hypothetical protein
VVPEAAAGRGWRRGRAPACCTARGAGSSRRGAGLLGEESFGVLACDLTDCAAFGLLLPTAFPTLGAGRDSGCAAASTLLNAEGSPVGRTAQRDQTNHTGLTTRICLTDMSTPFLGTNTAKGRLRISDVHSTR